MFEPIWTLPNYNVSKYFMKRGEYNVSDVTSKRLDELIWALLEPIFQKLDRV